MKIYGAGWSTCVSRVKLAMEEMGADYEVVEMDMAAGEHKTPTHLARNPFGQVPAFEDGDLKLIESRAIAKYVIRKCKTSSTPDLLREGNLKESAVVDVWTDVEAQRYNAAIGPIINQAVFGPMMGRVPNQQVIEDNVEKLDKVLDVYEARLSKAKYLAGDFYSFADLTHFPYTYYLMATPYKSIINSRPHVKAWWEKVVSRPASKKVAAGIPMAG